MVRALFPHAFRGRRLVNRDRFRAGGGQFERIGPPEPVSDPAGIDRPNSNVASTPTSPRGGREMRVTPKRSQQGQRRTHSCATTTPEVRRAIHASEENNIVLAERYGVNRKTIAMEGPRVCVRRANGPEKSLLERSHPGRK